MFVFIPLIIGGFPFLVTLVVTYRGSKHVKPSSENDTLTYNYILHSLTLIISLMGCIFSILALKLKKSRRVDLGYLIEKVVVIGVVTLDIVLIMIYFFGNSYLGNSLK